MDKFIIGSKSQKKLNKLKKEIEMVENLRNFAISNGIEFKCFSLIPPVHTRVGRFDFWPSTQRYCDYKNQVLGFGVTNLLEILTRQKQN